MTQMIDKRYGLLTTAIVPFAYAVALIGIVVAAPGAYADEPPTPSFQLAANDVISSIIVEGNQRIEPETVRSYMAFKQGDVYDDEKVDQSLKTLFATGLFADVTIRREANRLIVAIAENPVINRVAFEGNRAVNDDALETEVQLKARTIYTRAKVQGDVQRIVDVMRRSGRFSATVEPKVIQLPQNRVDLVFEIDEGPVTKIGGINFIGNREFSDGRLREIIATSQSAWWKFLSSSDNYDPDRLAFDRELLRRHYLSEGFADFQVVSAVADLSRDGEEFFITFTVEEGEQYTFGPSEVTTELDKLDIEKLNSLILTVEGDTYDAGLIDKTVDALTFEAGTKGYAFSEVRPRVRRDKETLIAAVTYRITEGPRAYVERINIDGNLRTLDRVIRREMRMAEGDAFNRVLLERSEKSIRALGFFAAVEVTEEPGSAPDQTIINVAVQEQSTGELSLGFGFSSVNSALADISLTERNFMGKGQLLRLRLALSGTRQQIDMRFTEPYFLGRDLVAGIDLFGVENNYQRVSGFNDRTTGFGFRFGFPLSENGRILTRYALRQDQIVSVAPAAQAFILPRNAIKSSVGYTYYLDRRNDPVEPTGGWDMEIDQEFTGVGGSVRYLRNEITARTYYEISEEFLASLRLKAGSIEGIGQDVNISDRFFIGGSDFRGFERSGVGPRDLVSDNALGAQAFAVGSAEVTFPNFLPEALDITTSFFSDVGIVGTADQQDLFLGTIPRVKAEDDLAPRVTAGISIYWQSPFGPVRIDLSNAIRKEDYDKTEAFRFSAGTRF
jgi:outer membrane protein insertion porin family|tara:strand:+ start:1171 stop:3528 length:2358 start_codon:yes stop_codon:yes gene_type:complete